MTTINLKDFYSWYTHDEYIEVPDEVAEELKADKRYEAAYRRRVTRNKAQYSLDCDDGIEYSACLHEPSPEELVLREERGNVKKCAVGKYPKSEKHGNTAQFSEVERSGTQENCGGIGSGCRLRLRPLPVLRRRQSQRVARIDPNAVVVDKNIAENDRFDLFSR